MKRNGRFESEFEAADEAGWVASTRQAWRARTGGDGRVKGARGGWEMSWGGGKGV